MFSRGLRNAAAPAARMLNQPLRANTPGVAVSGVAMTGWEEEEGGARVRERESVHGVKGNTSLAMRHVLTLHAS